VLLLSKQHGIRAPLGRPSRRRFTPSSSISVTSNVIARSSCCTGLIREEAECSSMQCKCTALLRLSPSTLEASFWRSNTAKRQVYIIYMFDAHQVVLIDMILALEMSSCLPRRLAYCSTNSATHGRPLRHSCLMLALLLLLHHQLMHHRLLLNNPSSCVALCIWLLDTCTKYTITYIRVA
jgi:hypothetical protein